MSKPIEETPILNGKDAEVFLENIKKNEFKTISVKELEEMKENFKKFNDISTSDSDSEEK
jgi:hypothetical protein